jgi:hypothetical protein
VKGKGQIDQDGWKMQINDDLINKSKFKRFFQQVTDFFKSRKEPTALYETQDSLQAITGLNSFAVKKRITLKKCVIWALIVILGWNIYSLHSFIQEIIKPNFITIQNQMVLKYILIAYMAFALGISSAIISLAGKWPQLLPIGDKKNNFSLREKKINSNDAGKDDDFDVSEYISKKY